MSALGDAMDIGVIGRGQGQGPTDCAGHETSAAKEGRLPGSHIIG